MKTVIYMHHLILYCYSHKKENMVNNSSYKCNFEGCDKQPSFNIIGQNAKFCVTHKTADMVNVRDICCLFPDCNKQPSYGIDKPLYCKAHKTLEMTNIKCAKCEHKDCNIQPCFDFKGGIGRFCAAHKLENMVDVKSNLCLFDECNKYPTFNYENEIKPLYCFSHKLDNMIDITHDRCKIPLCYVRGNPKYDGYCLRCYIHMFPDKPISRNFKTKERTVIDYILNKFPDVTWIADKKIYDGCSSKRPDLFLDLGYQVIIIEVDENQHTGYNCENKRMMEISQDVNHRPIIFIRFNPDSYYENNIKVPSCWSVNKKGLLTLRDKEEWNDRLRKLKKTVKKWLTKVSEKTIQSIQLFYDE
uniref:Uncharacterized protein n=1 Tax=viral metagenome TaxID=1070528 RepID=A0A6C0D8R9_9ZZZZ